MSSNGSMRGAVRLRDSDAEDQDGTMGEWGGPRRVQVYGVRLRSQIEAAKLANSTSAEQAGVLEKGSMPSNGAAPGISARQAVRLRHSAAEDEDGTMGACMHLEGLNSRLGAYFQLCSCKGSGMRAQIHGSSWRRLRLASHG